MSTWLKGDWGGQGEGRLGSGLGHWWENRFEVAARGVSGIFHPLGPKG